MSAKEFLRIANMIFNNRYSGLITGGLGLNACEGLLTMGFHLFHVEVKVIGHTGGGGPWPAVPVYPMANQPQHPAYYMKWDKANLVSTKLILVTIKMQDKKWTKQFVVETTRAKLIVKAVNFTQSTINNISATVAKFSRATKRAIAKFTGVKRT